MQETPLGLQHLGVCVPELYEHGSEAVASFPKLVFWAPSLLIPVFCSAAWVPRLGNWQKRSCIFLVLPTQVDAVPTSLLGSRPEMS